MRAYRPPPGRRKRPRAGVPGAPGLDLLLYERIAANAHFGREEPEFTWEATDKALALKQAA